MKYNCPKCSSTNTEEEWNNETIAEYGEDSVLIGEGVKGTILVCPENGCNCLREEITKSN